MVLDLARAQRKAGHEVYIAAGPVIAKGRDLSHITREWEIPRKVISLLRRDVIPVMDLGALIQLFFVVREGHYDVVHCHTSKAGFLGRIAGYLNRTAVIVYSPHGNIFYGYFNPLTTALFTFLEGLAASFTHKIVTLTNIEIEEYLRRNIGRSEQFTAIYNGVDDRYFIRHRTSRVRLRRSLGLKPTSKVIITTGRLTPVKGIDDLLRAFKAVADAIPNVFLLVVGEGPEEERLKALAERLDIKGKVIFLGWRDDVDRLLECADIFALSSRNEGFGLSIVEAMGKGLPVVATCVGGVPEVVIHGKTGITVPPSDIHAMSSAIIKILRNRKYGTEIAKNASVFARGHFTIRKMVEDTEALYYHILEHRA